MTTARDVMTPEAKWVADDEPIAEVARRLDREGIGAVPVCDTDGHLTGVITDRDIVVKVIAADQDPQQVVAGDIAGQSEVVTIGADDPIEEAIRTMKEHDIRRLPVIDGDRFVGMVSQADVARELPDSKVGDLVAAISSAGPNG